MTTELFKTLPDADSGQLRGTTPRFYCFESPLALFTLPTRGADETEKEFDKRNEAIRQELYHAFARLRQGLRGIDGQRYVHISDDASYITIYHFPWATETDEARQKFDKRVVNLLVMKALREPHLFPGYSQIVEEQISVQTESPVTEPEVEDTEEPEGDDNANRDNAPAAATIMLVEEDPNDNLSKEEILALLAFWRRITESTRAILCHADLKGEVAGDELYSAIDQLMIDYKKLCTSGRSWTWSELQYELAGNAEIFRFIAGVLRYVDGFVSNLTPDELLLQRLAFIANRIPLPLTITEDGIMPIAPNGPAEPHSPSEESTDAPIDPAGEDIADPATADTDRTVPHQRTSIDGNADGTSNT